MLAVIMLSFTFGAMMHEDRISEALGQAPYFSTWMLVTVVVFLTLNILIVGASIIGIIDNN
jgi:hypothetical protein